MKKAYTYDLVTAIFLLGIIETYFWTQSRTFVVDSATTKILLIILYAVLAIASQAVISSALHLGVLDALKANALVACVLSVGLTLLVFSLHPAVLKDVQAGWANAIIASLKFLVTIGFGTLLVRMLVAGISARVRRT